MSLSQEEKKVRITVVAFTDDLKNSVSYRNFSTIDGAVEFYRKMLELDIVNTISTRKVKETILRSGSPKSKEQLRLYP